MMAAHSTVTLKLRLGRREQERDRGGGQGHTLRRRDFNPREGAEGGEGPSPICDLEGWFWRFRKQKVCECERVSV